MLTEKLHELLSLAAKATDRAERVRESTAMLGSTCKWRFSRQLPIWSRKALFSSLSALRAAPSTVAARNVSSLPPHSQRAAAAAVAAEGQQAAMDTDGQSFGEAATARPFSDIPGAYIPQQLIP